jgi:hypothetical protein
MMSKSRLIDQTTNLNLKYKKSGTDSAFLIL